MPKLKKIYVCESCDYRSLQWLGRCPECQAWNSFQEDVVSSPNKTSKHSLLEVGQSSEAQITSLKDIEALDSPRIISGIAEFDRVLGGGFVKGSATLIGGEPGIGKSTIMLQLANSLAKVTKIIYISAEENPQQIQLRAKRLNIYTNNILIYPEPALDIALAKIKDLQAESLLVIVDSIQTVYTADIEGLAGTISQVKESSAKIVNFAKGMQIPVIIIGHVTKEGGLAGPKLLEHLVDTVVYLEGDRYSDLRIMRAVKNRFGPVNEIGLFEMTGDGLIEVSDPFRILMNKSGNMPGTIDSIVLEGMRLMPVEIQSLVTKSYIPIPRRTAQGMDLNRLQLIIAVLTKRLKIPLYEQDIFVNIVGGVSIKETSIDLAVAMAILSSYYETIIPASSIAYGEVGLLGEIRPTTKEKLRQAEALQRGYQKIISYDTYKDLKILAKDLFSKTH